MPTQAGFNKIKSQARFLIGIAKLDISTQRMVVAVASLTLLGLLGLLVPALVKTGAGLGVALGVLLAVAMIGTAVTALWQLTHVSHENKGDSLLREAFDSVLTPLLITDQHGRMILANRAFRGWIDVSAALPMQALTARFSATSQAAGQFKSFHETLYKGQSSIVELPVLRGNRIVEWRRLIGRPIEGGLDGGRYFHWRFEDISERKRMEKAMRDEQSKLLDFMTHAPVGIYSADQHGRFRFVNKTLADWLQVMPEDLVKGDVRVHDVMVDPPKAVSAHAIAAGAHGELRGEVMLRRRDGQIFPAAIAQTVVIGDDGKTLRTRSVVRDLTPEREWQQALNVSESRFQHLFAEAPIGVVLLDKKFAIVECNQAFQSLMRRGRETLIGINISDLMVPNDRHAALDQLGHVLKGADLYKPVELRMAAPREVVANVYVKRFSAISNQSNDAEGLMLYFIDATEQRRLESQFAQSQKMQAIGQLAGGVAHDFNNLLTAMIGFCDLLLQRHKPGDQSFSDIMQIKQNGNRAANLVRQLLAFSRQQTLQPKVINLIDVLSELSNLLRRLIGASIKLDVSHGRDLGLVKVDQGQLEQVIINLVVNARDAMQSGGSVSIRTFNHRQKDLALRGQDEMPPGNYVVIEVTDTGTGIPKDILSRIFEPFFSTKEVGSGTGLGLSTVYGIVRQTGGFVDVESEVGRGTTFHVYLPAHVATAEDKNVQAANDDRIEDKPGPDLTGAGTILLVEDEDAVRVFSARALRNKGYNVLEARSGDEALAILDKDGASIDLTITDVVMPQMDGPTLYKHIRGRWPNMKVVFVSGYTEDRLREQFKSGEPIHFLGKPFSLKQLASKVKEIFGEAA